LASEGWAVERLRACALFAQARPEVLAEVARALRRRRFRRNEVIFHQGDPGDSLHIIASGAVKIVLPSAEGEEAIIATLREGDFFGELSLLDGRERTADAHAMEPTGAMEIDREALEGLFRKHPGAALDVLTVIGKRLREADRLLQSASSVSPNQEVQQQTTSVQRLAEWLAAFSGSLPFLALHILLFLTWVLLNVGLFRAVRPFDPFPFGFLTMATSLESIFLACFVLIAQNRQAASDRIRSDVEYAANIKAGLEVTQLHSKVDALYAETMARLAAVERGMVLRPGS